MQSENRIALNISTAGLAWVFFCLRLFARYRTRRKHVTMLWIWSDVFIGIALSMSAVTSIFDSWIRFKKIEYDKTPGLTAEQIELGIKVLQAAFINNITFITILWSVKASFLFSYVGMAKFLSKSLRGLLIASAVLLGVTYIAMILILVLWCRPIELNWSTSGNTCSAQTSTLQTILFFILHIGTDIPILLLPVFIVRSLQLARGEKFALFFIYLLGILTIASSTIRTVIHLRFIRERNHSDVETKIENIYVISLAEAFGCLVLVCLPSLRAMLRTMRQATVSDKVVSQFRDGDTFELIRPKVSQPHSFESRIQGGWLTDDKQLQQPLGDRIRVQHEVHVQHSDTAV